MDQVLKYGDLVFLNILDHEEVERISNRIEKIGFLGSNGFMQEKLWVKFLLSEKKEISESMNKIFKNNKSFDYKTCLFVVLPSLSFMYFKEKKKTEERIELFKQKLHILNNEDDSEINLDDLEDLNHFENSKILKNKSKIESILENEYNRLEKINLNYELEKKDNELKIKDFEKRNVNYKDEIILQHFISEYYVNVSSKNNKKNSLNKKAVLSPFLSKNVLLRLKPRFKYRKSNSSVHYNDDIIITSLKKEFALKFNKDKFCREDNKKFDFILRPKIKKRFIAEDVFYCYFSNEKPFIWKIIFFSTNMINSDKICGGDLIRILHLNNEEYLTSDLSYSSLDETKEEVYKTKKINKKNSTANSVWEINHYDSTKNLSANFDCANININSSQNKNTKFYIKNFLLERVISSSEKDKCTIFPKYSYFKFNKNIASNENIKNNTSWESSIQSHDLKNLNENSKNFSDSSFVVDINKSEPKELPFQFFSILQNVNTLINKNAYYIKCDLGFIAISNKTLIPFWEQINKKNEKKYHKKENNFWTNYKKLKNNNQTVDHLEKSKSFYPYNSLDKEQKKYLVEYKKNTSAENTFLIEKLSKEEIKEIYFLKSFLFYIIGLRQKINEQKELKKMDCIKLAKKIRRFTNFLFNYEENKILFLKEYYDFNLINKKRQSMVKRFLIIDTLTDILHICHFENDFFQRKALKHQIVYLEEISTLINETLQFIIGKNKNNVHYCSQWLEMFVKLSIKNLKYELDLNVELILMQLLKNNSYLINNRISKAVIEKFVQLLIKYRKHQNIKILRNLIKCQNRVIYKNQREVTILLLKDSDKREKFLFEIIKISKMNFKISIPVLGWHKIDINNYVFEKNSDFFEQNYQFFYESVKLIGELCKSRNYLCINLLQKNFGFELLIEFINYLNKTNLQLKIVFIKLLVNLYIDVYDFNSHQYKSPLRFLKKNINSKSQNDSVLTNKKIQNSKDSFKPNNPNNDTLFDSSDSEMSIMVNNHEEDKKDDFNENEIKELKNHNVMGNKKNIIFKKDIEIFEKTKFLNKFLEINLKLILKMIKYEEIEFYYFKFITECFELLKILLKTEIILERKMKTFYNLLISVMIKLEEKNFINLDTEKENYWQKKSEPIYIDIKILFCKIIKIFNYKNFKIEINKVYFLNKQNFKKESIFETYFLKEREGAFKEGFVNKNQLMDIFTTFVINNKSGDFKLTHTSLKAIHFLNSKYQFIQKDFEQGVFIKNENEHIYKYFYNFSLKIAKIAENCQKWLIVDAQNEMLELKNYLVDFFGIILRCVKEKKKIWEFNPELEIDGANLLQLREFTSKNYLLYYVNFFYQKEKSETFKFIQKLSTALPIIKSFFTILDWSFKFRHFGSLKFKEDSKLIYLLIAILTYKNDSGIDFIVKHYERLLLNLYEKYEDFCIVFYNYCCSENHLLNKIINKSQSLYNFFYVILKRCSESNGNNLYKSYNFNILARILSSPKMHNNERIFNNIQLYIFLNLKRYYNLNNLLRDASTIEKQSQEPFKKILLHNNNVSLVPSELGLSYAILTLMKKFAIGNNKLTKSVCQSFYSVKSIAKILKSEKVRVFFKLEILSFLNKVYLYKDNTNIFNFKDIIDNMWINLITILERNLKSIKRNNFKIKEDDEKVREDENKYIMLTIKFSSIKKIKEKFMKNLFQSIKFIVLKYIDLKLNEIEKLTYFAGIIEFLDLKKHLVKNSEYEKMYFSIIKILKENWTPGLSKKEKIIEDKLVLIKNKENLEDENIEETYNDKNKHRLKSIITNKLIGRKKKSKKLNFLKFSHNLIKLRNKKLEKRQNPLVLLKKKFIRKKYTS